MDNSNFENAGEQTANTQSGRHPAKGTAIASLVCGLAAMVVPIPILDIVVGIIGIALSRKAKNQGYPGGLATAGFVCSILGTIFSVIFTFNFFAGRAGAFDPFMW
jgi:hypothetical protein